jgi:hypothetical protein
MAEASGRLSPSRTAPRLRDCWGVRACTCAVEGDARSEPGAWDYLLSSLRVGWVVAPPRLLPASDQWLTVAYNVRGCLADDAYTSWVDRDRLETVFSLGMYFEGGDDAGCFRALNRRLD